MTKGIIFFLLIPFFSTAQVIVDLDTTFNPGTSSNNEIRSLLLQPDGKVIVYGPFSNFAGLTKNNLARLNANGTLDGSFDCGSSFNQQYPNTISAFLLQPDGKLILAGYFTSFNGTQCNNIVRLNSDGSVDTGFITGTGFNSAIFSLGIQSDGKIIVGGFFTSFNGDSCKKIARLNPNGSFDNAFQIGTGFITLGTNPACYVAGLLVENTDQILVGGLFNNYNNQNYRALLRLNPNGTVDQTFSIGTGFDSRVEKIIKQPDNKYLVFGQFTQYDSHNVNGGIRLSSVGSHDSTFTFPSSIVSGSLKDIKLKNDGKLIYSAQIYPNYTVNTLGQLTSTGEYDSLNFKIGIGFTSSYSVHAIVIQSDNKILVGGDFNTYRGHTCKTVGRLIEKSVVGLEENKLDNLKQVYPNPTSGTLSFKNVGLNSQLKTYNLTGSLISTDNIHDDWILDLSFLPNGLYYYKIYTDGVSVKADKLIIAK
jgi:uncharacterized delta-60 repeat protein